jgi:hypothetical protein
MVDITFHLLCEEDIFIFFWDFKVVWLPLLWKGEPPDFLPDLICAREVIENQSSRRNAQGICSIARLVVACVIFT